MSARSQVTVTLGRNVQVIKRARRTSDGGDAGGEWPVRERLQSDTADSNSYGSQYENKRQRTEGHHSRFIDKNMRSKQRKSTYPVDRNDLRWKLMQKSLSRRRHVAEQQDDDLREKLSRRTHSSSRSDTRKHLTESSTSGIETRIPSTRTSDNLETRIPSTRTSDNLHELDSYRRSYSLSFDRQMHMSMDRPISTPRQLSPSRRYGELQHAPMIRSLDASRSSFLPSGGVGDASGSFTFLTKNTTPMDVAKPVARSSALEVRPSAPEAIGQISILKPEEPLTVAGLLGSLGLGKYAILFEAEEVDMTALRQMGDNDLKEMGIPMGPRKKILLAVLSHARQRQTQPQW
ncbi:hypothetical protein Cni_G05091 [Canna indica]|uniref:SAM domain-containing protein n=1 Tax=Canna indica TaxID=4628 RepID=A0AAQ3Q544_9LILI|nr:hypothetical protein Cni_G05091 [Canna indica]